MLGSFLLFSNNQVHADDVSDIVQDSRNISLPYDGDLLKVGEDMLIETFNQYNVNLDSWSLDYSDKLQFIQNEDDSILPESSRNQILDYISFYLSEIASIQLIDGSNQEDVLSALEKMNRFAFDEKRNINLDNLQEFDDQQNPLARAAKPSRSFNVKKANEYAARYAKGRNAIDYPKFSNDCTNFASQIAKAGGMGTSNSYTNYSGGYWHPSILSKNKAWYNASTFFNFFNAEGMRSYGAANKAEVNSKAETGDMLCYISRSTGVVDHIAYVNRKTGGKIYISQHTTDRKDEKFDDIDVFSGVSYVIVLRFRRW